MPFAGNIFAWIFFFFFAGKQAVLHRGSQIRLSETTIHIESVARADPHFHTLQFHMQICTAPQANGSLGA